MIKYDYLGKKLLIPQILSYSIILGILEEIRPLRINSAKSIPAKLKIPIL